MFIINKVRKSLLPVLLSFGLFDCNSQNVEAERIRLNQLGFYPQGPKVAIIVKENVSDFSIVDISSMDTVYKGKLSEPKIWKPSKETVRKADFSALKIPGKYVVYVPGIGNSYPFSISSQVHHAAGKASLKAFYYIRASTEITKKHAGKWARNAGHPDTDVIIHPSATSGLRKEGSKISSSRGWYDAGDYNKYIVNSGISTYTLLSIYEHFPLYADTLMLNIPESNNYLPDILDEVLWNLRWMLTMQDKDGGVYHKLTNANFDGSIMPEAAVNPRYVVKKTTAASLDFAAVTAQASRVFKKFNTIVPGLSDSLQKSAVLAYEWAKKNPDVLYDQEAMNLKFKPAITTGAYGDQNVKDEFQWVALELFISTGKPTYYSDANLKGNLQNTFLLPDWKVVNTLGLYSLAANKNIVKGIDEIKTVENKIVGMAEDLVKGYKQSAYGVPMGGSSKDFIWGSNAVAANQGILLLQAFRITNEKIYLEAAMANLDYLLGRNATGYSFLTGFGTKSTKDPHHRPSESDNNSEPIPGLLAGGPNPRMEDAKECDGKYNGKDPATAYIDDRCSYASNEIAINWNAPMAYLILAIEAIHAKDLK